MFKTNITEASILLLAKYRQTVVIQIQSLQRHPDNQYLVYLLKYKAFV